MFYNAHFFGDVRFFNKKHTKCTKKHKKFAYVKSFL